MTLSPVEPSMRVAGPKPLRLTSDQLEAFDHMRAMRLPTALIAKHLGLPTRSLYRRLSHEPVQKITTPNTPAWREARSARIKSHIQAYPNKSLFGGEE